MRYGVTIYFIRHGQTDWNAASRYQGQVDIPLNDLGRAQARRNGDMLRQTLPDPGRLDYVASPLSRASETMRIVRGALGLPAEDFRRDDLLKEVHYGNWEGRLASEIPDHDPEGHTQRLLDPFRWRPKGGESYADLMVRSDAWLAGVARDTVVASHGGVSRTLRARVLGLDNGAQIVNLEVPQDLILVLTAGGSTWL
jgi:probable phosphoglycerate mutase